MNRHDTVEDKKPKLPPSHAMPNNKPPPSPTGQRSAVPGIHQAVTGHGLITNNVEKKQMSARILCKGDMKRHVGVYMKKNQKRKVQGQKYVLKKKHPMNNKVEGIHATNCNRRCARYDRICRTIEPTYMEDAKYDRCV